MKMKFKLVESFSKVRDIALDYTDIVVYADYHTDYWNGPQWTEKEVDWTYYVSEEDCSDLLIEKYSDSLSEEEYESLEKTYGKNLYAFLETYVENHFDTLFEKYLDDIIAAFREDAENDAAENWSEPEPDYDDIDD